MGKVYLRPAGVDRPVPGLGDGEQGPDADDPGADAARSGASGSGAIRASSRTCCATSRSWPGIGNAYSDEILHAAGLLPFRKRASLAPEEVDALYDATRSTLATRSRSCASACRRHSRNRCATSSRSTTRAGSRVRAAGRRITEVKRRRVHHLVLPRLPALSATSGSGDLQDLADLEARRIADAVQVADRLGRRPELGRDPDQRVAGLDLVVRVAGAADGSGAGRRDAVPVPPDAGGAAVGSARGAGGRVAAASAATRWRGAPTTPGNGDPSLAAAELPLVSFARTIAANASAIRAMSTAWPVDRSELRIGTVIESRPWSRTTGVVRAIGRGSGAERGRGRSVAPRGRPRTWRTSRSRASGTAGAASRWRAGPAARPRRSDARARRSCCATRHRRQRDRDRCGSPGGR